MPEHQLRVGADPGAVPAGRHFTSSALQVSCDEEVVDAAELVVTELLTNALLHGAAPVQLVVCTVDGGAARVEVHDASRVLPIRPRPSTDGMTGRGLALVDALSCQWGVDPAGDGKIVWAEVTPDSARAAEPGDVDLDALLAGFTDDDDDPTPRTRVTLPDVPVELLLTTEAHVDSVVRDLALAAAGAQSGVSASAPRELVAQVADAVRGFAEVRTVLKRQASAAAERGDDRVALELGLGPGAVDAARGYLAALEEADAYARSARLLALAARPQHAVFRRWYVNALIARLSDDAGAALPSFEDHLLAEVDHLAELQAVSDRAVRLQGVSAELAAALDHDEVTRIALDAALAALAAPRGLVLLSTPAGLRVGSHVGLSPERAAALDRLWESGQSSPATAAAETRRGLFFESREELVAHSPAFAALERDAAATCAVPLIASDRVVGVLRLSFPDSRLFRADEQAFLSALGAVAAQALERADLHDAQALLADRLLRLQAVSSALAGTRSADEVLDVTMTHATGLVGARVASISLLREGTSAIDLVRISPAPPKTDSWDTFDLHDAVPAAEAIRTGNLLWAANLAERDARWPAVADAHADFEHSFAAVPLQAEGAVLGALTVSFPAPHVAPSHDFLRAFADTCAQALQRVRSAAAAAESGRRLAFLARASEELSGTLDVETTLGNLARVTVPAMADWCVVHLVQDDALVCVAVEHVDPVKRDLAVEVQRRWPETLDDAGVGSVLRTGEPLLVRSVPDERDAAQVRDPDRQAVLDRLGLRSTIVVPLSARGRALGALSFITAESGREYGPDDLAMAEDLARRAGVAVDNARLYAMAAGATAGEPGTVRGLVQRPRAESMPRHADDALLRWHLAQEAGRLGSWDLDVVTGALTWDEQCAALFGTTVEDFEREIGGLTARTHPDDLPAVMEQLQRTITEGEPLDVEYRALLPGGALRHVLSRGRGIQDADGRVVRVVGAVVDVTELREAASAESRAALLLAGLGDVALRLAAASTVEDLTRVVIQHGMAVLGADGGAVCVRDDAHGTVRLTMTDSVGEQVQLEYGELPLDGPLPGSHTARTGETVLLPTRQSGLAFSPAMRSVYEGTGRGAWVSVSLKAGGRLLGSLVVSWAEERQFSAQDSELFAAFAAQCAQALDRIQTLEAERRAAQAARRLSETLQRSLLTRPPEPDHLQVAVRYVPASQEAQVGGDWYDAFLTRDQALSLVIGDCTGHDREAVASMAAVRNLLRATAYAVDGAPSRVLTALEETMAGLSVNALATALLARVEQTDEERERGVRRLVWSSAGHLPPLLRRADGAITLLTSPPDLMLGLLPSTDRWDHSLELQPDSTLLLYTDGLVERRGEDIDAGLDRLRQAVDEIGDVPLDELCDALLDRLGASAEDDVALLAVRFHDENRPRPPEAGPTYVPDSRPLEG